MNQKSFLEKLSFVENSLEEKNAYKNISPTDCPTCDAKNIASKTFKIDDIEWDNGLTHHIERHGKPLEPKFVEKIVSKTLYIPKKFKKIQQFRDQQHAKKIKIPSIHYTKDKKRYMKIDKNQILIMDALMKHGSYNKKYMDRSVKGKYRYSEHAGLLDFDHKGLEKIVVSGRTNRVDPEDEEIFLPKNMIDAYDYEYIFHTHPATPKPGGRASQGILYEFPSINDVLHFVEHYNNGETQGSIVIAPEGMYIIRKYIVDDKELNFDENKMIKTVYKRMIDLQHEAIKKYGSSFNTQYFHSKIGQDTKYIDGLNKSLHKYGLHIDYQPRIEDSQHRWFIDSIYLPVYSIEPKMQRREKKKSKKSIK
jgi:hypothetical protein